MRISVVRLLSGGIGRQLALGEVGRDGHVAEVVEQVVIVVGAQPAELGLDLLLGLGRQLALLHLVDDGVDLAHAGEVIPPYRQDAGVVEHE